MKSEKILISNLSYDEKILDFNKIEYSTHYLEMANRIDYFSEYFSCYYFSW